MTRAQIAERLDMRAHINDLEGKLAVIEKQRADLHLTVWCMVAAQGGAARFDAKIMDAYVDLIGEVSVECKEGIVTVQAMRRPLNDNAPPATAGAPT